jgi:hypothetical protein
MSHNSFEHIWWCLHFNNNELQAQATNRLFKIQPVLEFFAEKFQDVYNPNQQLSLVECVIPWRGRFRIYELIIRGNLRSMAYLLV